MKNDWQVRDHITDRPPAPLLQSYKKADEPPSDSENILKESIAKTISPCRKDPKRSLSL